MLPTVAIIPLAPMGHLSQSTGPLTLQHNLYWMWLRLKTCEAFDVSTRSYSCLDPFAKKGMFSLGLTQTVLDFSAECAVWWIVWLRGVCSSVFSNIRGVSFFFWLAAPVWSRVASRNRTLHALCVKYERTNTVAWYHLNKSVWIICTRRQKRLHQVSRKCSSSRNHNMRRLLKGHVLHSLLLRDSMSSWTKIYDARCDVLSINSWIRGKGDSRS